MSLASGTKLSIVLDGVEMNKKGLIDQVSEAMEMPRTDATRSVEVVLDTIAEALFSGDSVQLLGFGTFSLRDRAARTGRNPSTGQPIDIPAKRDVKFKGGSKLLERLQADLEKG